MKYSIKKLAAALAAAVLALTLSCPAFAAGTSQPAAAAPAAQTQTVEEETDAGDATGTKALSAALVVGLAAAAGGLAMGMAISKSVEGISRQPEAEGKIRTSLMLGLVFIETAIIYALIVGILIIFVL